MESTPRSSLNNVQLRFVGFCFLNHPIKPNWFCQTSIYQHVEKADKFVICVSEGRGKGKVNFARMGLGGIAAGRDVAPYAQRHLEGCSFELMKEILEKSQNAKWYWNF